MTQEKRDELVIHLLVSVLSELHITRDMIFAQLSKQLDATEQQQNNAIKGVAENITDRKKAILAQIKLYYEGGFGSVDDLLAAL